LFHRAGRQRRVPWPRDTHRAGPVQQQHSRATPDHVPGPIPVAKDLPEPQSHTAAAERSVQQHVVPADGGA